MTMVQVMSLEQPANGWFIPYCQGSIDQDKNLIYHTQSTTPCSSCKVLQRGVNCKGLTENVCSLRQFSYNSSFLPRAQNAQHPAWCTILHISNMKNCKQTAMCQIHTMLVHSEQGVVNECWILIYTIAKIKHCSLLMRPLSRGKMSKSRFSLLEKRVMY